jgi:hypothetical protein
MDPVAVALFGAGPWGVMLALAGLDDVLADPDVKAVAVPVDSARHHSVGPRE